MNRVMGLSPRGQGVPGAIVDRSLAVPQRALVSDSPPDAAAGTTSTSATDAALPASPPTPAVAGGAVESVPGGNTSWELAKKLKADGLDRPQMIEKLKATGLDEESAIVLINSIAGALPADLPDAQLSPGINVLSPSTFTLSDIGLTGPPTTVGLYWMGFGAAILLALGVGFIMTETLGRELPEDVGFYAVRFGGFISMCCVGWGVFRYSQGITIRRK